MSVLLESLKLRLLPTPTLFVHWLVPCAWVTRPEGLLLEVVARRKRPLNPLNSLWAPRLRFHLICINIRILNVFNIMIMIMITMIMINVYIFF